MMYRVINMKKAKKILSVIILLIFSIYCLFCAEEVRNAAFSAIDRCLRSLIPSLYIMMILSSLLISSGIISAMGNFAERTLGRFLPMNGETMITFLFASVAGYPVGAKMIYSQYTQNRIDRKSAIMWSGVCFGAGSAFIFGCTASGAAGKLIMISTAAANLILAAVISIFGGKKSSATANPRKIAVSTDMLTNSVTSAGKSMAEICFVVTAFSVITALLRRLGIIAISGEILAKFFSLPTSAAETLIAAFLDVTAVSELPRNNFTLLPITATAISFGGICVFFQISAIFRGKLPILPMLFIRVCGGILSGIICRLLLPYFIFSESVAVSAVTPKIHQAASPVPSIILVIMTAILFIKVSPRKT